MKRRFYPLTVTAISVLRSGLCRATAFRILAIGLLLATAGVQAQTSTSAPSGPKKPARAAQATTLPLADATVESVLRESGELVLDHGDLPNLAMPAMTMAFDVGNKKMLDAVKAGDKIRFQAEVVKGRPTITHLEQAR
jgi:Cu/Ag efflux protein CusF